MNAGARLGDRGGFSRLEAHAYLAHAAVSPLSDAVLSAVADTAATYAEDGLGAVMPAVEGRERLRADLAALIGARARDVGFVPNTTYGVIEIAQGIAWQPGDRVVLFEGEFPANTTPWQLAAERFDLELHWLSLEPFLRSHEEGLQSVRTALQQGARLIAVSFVQFRSGLQMPLLGLSRLAHEAGAELFVDGIQGVGATPLDVMEAGVDYLSCGGHKWLMGPEGGGFVFIHPERIEHFRPALAGWLGHEDALRFLFEGPGQLRYDRPLRKRADVVEAGGLNALGYAGLMKAVQPLRQLGPSAIHAHVQQYFDQLEPELVARGFTSLRSSERDGRSTILSMEVPEGHSAAQLNRALRGHGVVCSTPDGALRFAPHWPNALEEVSHVVSALDAALGSAGQAFPTGSTGSHGKPV